MRLTDSQGRVRVGIAIIIIALILSSTHPSLQAQTAVTFSPADKFIIPTYNGTISFAVNGSYSKATLQNDTWIFTNLHLNNSRFLETLRFSAQNSNVTIVSYQTANTTRQSARLRYMVEGKGKQIVNLGIGSQEAQFNGADWSVITGNNVFLAHGEGWTISQDGTLTLTGLAGNVTIVHYIFFDSFGSTSKLPFYQQHSIIIIAAIGVAVTVTIAVAIKVKSREKSWKPAKSALPVSQKAENLK